MNREKKKPPECRNCGKILKWLPWSGKPQPPVDPATGNPCDCWKSKGGGDSSNKPRFITKANFKKCLYCDGYYDKDAGNEEHERIYHQDKKVHTGKWVINKGCFEDEIPTK